jgi:hypothetical protein
MDNVQHSPRTVQVHVFFLLHWKIITHGIYWTRIFRLNFEQAIRRETGAFVLFFFFLFKLSQQFTSFSLTERLNPDIIYPGVYYMDTRCGPDTSD